MKLSADLSPGWIYVKGLMFLLILVASSVLNVFTEDVFHRVLLTLFIIWSASRLYYFMFYVIEHYIDDSYKFSSVYACLRYLITRRGKNAAINPSDKDAH